MTSQLHMPAAGDDAITLHPLPIDVFDPEIDHRRYVGRGSVRRTIMAMRPVDGEAPQLPLFDRVGASNGAFWGLRAQNDLHLMLRTAAFATPRAARDDAIEVLLRVHDFQTITVQADNDGLYSFWIALNNRVVLVAGQAWRDRRRSSSPAIRDALAMLPRVR